MGKFLFLLLAVGALLLSLGLVALAQAGGSPQPGVTMLSGGHYRLVSLDVGVSVLAAGGGYMLRGPAVPELQGSGCCCTYLPCVLRSFP
jgi:hypothetical protein